MTERKLIVLTNVTEEPGKINRGKELLITLPTGDEVYLPFVIASGVNPGPTLLLTGNIHGDEVTGVVVIHRFLESLDLSKLRGTIVAVPSLNPTGLLAATRFPQFESKDPNRAWPDARPEKDEKDDNQDLWKEYSKRIEDEKGPQARAFAKIAKIFKQIKPQSHLDLHTFSILSHPFSFVDRVLYNDQQTAEESQKLFDKTWDMVSALGLTSILEESAQAYTKSRLHRSTSGFTLNYMRIPSCTIEMGPMHAVRPDCRDAILDALQNWLVWNTSIEGTLKKITQVPTIQFPELHRHLAYPQTPVSGIVDFVKNASDRFVKGDVLAYVRKLDGTMLTKIEAEFDGYLIAWHNEIAKYEGEELGMVAVVDGNTPKVVPWSILKE